MVYAKIYNRLDARGDLIASTLYQTLQQTEKGLKQKYQKQEMINKTG